MKRLSSFKNSPPIGGPYSLAVETTGPLLFVSGQGPWDPTTGKFERGSIADQTTLTLNNIKRVVEAAGGKMENVVSCRVFLQPLDVQTFATMNEIYKTYFPENQPVRTTVGAQLLNIDVEIDCVVALE
jgi:2-iminobutanoate/2-iminopropanoate deaminase